MKSQRGEVVRIILLGGNIVGKDVILRPISFHGVRVLISIDHVYTQFRPAPKLRNTTGAKVGARLYTFYHFKRISYTRSVQTRISPTQLTSYRAPFVRCSYVRVV
jgi:hypothetical protein